MKRILPLLIILISLSANAQNYLISFSGTGLSSVKVENLTSGLIVNLSAEDILHLSTATTIDNLGYSISDGLNIHPNPVVDNSIMDILPPVPGEVFITVSDISGKVIGQRQEYLENQLQEFIISGLGNGLYFVNVQGVGFQFSEKLLSTGRSGRKAVIEWLGKNSGSTPDKITTTDNKGSLVTVDMAYNNGERLKFTATAGNNKTVLTDIPTQDKTVSFTFFECKDGDNNYYPIVQLGTQIWMAENLKTTKYLNGDLIGTTTPATLDIGSETSPKYQWAYDGNEDNAAISGRLYTLYALRDSRKVCPAGWHLPTGNEWYLLEDYLITSGFNYDGTTTGNKYAKALASTSGWFSSASEGTIGNTDFQDKRDATGFTSLPGGFRYRGGAFMDSVKYGYWWTNSSMDTYKAYYCLMNYNSYAVSQLFDSKHNGYSVRCVMD